MCVHFLVYLKYSLVRMCMCVCVNFILLNVNEHFFPWHIGVRRSHTYAHTNWRIHGASALRSYEHGRRVVVVGGGRGVRNISIVHAQCSLSGNQLLPMATANGVAPSHNVTLQAPLDERARGWFDIYYYYCYYLSPRDKKDKVIKIYTIYIILYMIYYDVVLYIILKRFSSITRGMVLGNVFVIERLRLIWHDVVSVTRRRRMPIVIVEYIKFYWRRRTSAKIQFLDSKCTNECIHFGFYDVDMWFLLLPFNHLLEQLKCFNLNPWTLSLIENWI